MGNSDAPDLKRKVTLLNGISLIVGTMIGLLERTNSVLYSLIVWTLCGVLSMLGALAYAELGTMIPSSGAEYSYFLAAFGPFYAFIFSWISTIIIKPAQLAIICLSFSEYVVEAFAYECNPNIFILKLVATATVVLVTLINCLSVKLATTVQTVFCVCKIIAIVIIIVGGLYQLITGGSILEISSSLSQPSAGSLAIAFYSGLWAYDGWNNLNYVTEEIVNPRRNLPLSIIIAIPLVTICYLMVNISYLTIMTPSEMIISDAVALTFGERILGSFFWLMPLSVAISTFGSANGTIFAAGRLTYVASREGHLIQVLSFVHKHKLTPTPAILFHALIAELMILSGSIDTLIDFFSFTVWIFYGMSMVALLLLRKTQPSAYRPYKVPVIIPVIVLIASFYLVLAPIFDNPKMEYLYTILFIGLGCAIYIPIVKNKSRMFSTSRITHALQILINLVPPSNLA